MASAATINAEGSDDAWQRQAVIEVDDGTSAVLLHTMTETIDVDMGERDLDKIDLLNLGQIPKHGAVGITTVTFEGYPLQAGSASASEQGTGFFDIFASKPVVDDSGELDVDMSNTLTRYRVAILWTDDANAIYADEEIDEGDRALRFVMADCFCTSCKTSFTDGVLKQTLTFKGTAFAKDATARIKMESCTASETLTALGTYTPGTSPWT